MNLVYGEIVELFVEDAMRFGKIRIGGAFKNVSLELLADAERGDTVLMCDGVAISKVEKLPKSEWRSSN
ncbi:MAG: HypC/HybG/HupF family hydrogenase formation chaperone [Verrucomicrobiota bacterium]|nr:HypC/HybG/HupF family hydrogenase formation chaperone [Verrucomicrobiota bacterium]